MLSGGVALLFVFGAVLGGCGGPTGDAIAVGVNGMQYKKNKTKTPKAQKRSGNASEKMRFMKTPIGYVKNIKFLA
jgi:hypothetical protein